MTEFEGKSFIITDRDELGQLVKEAVYIALHSAVNIFYATDDEDFEAALDMAKRDIIKDAVYLIDQGLCDTEGYEND